MGGILAACNSEYRYQGKTLKEWLIVYDAAAANTQKEHEAEAAVRAMGKNALPQLVKWIANGDVMAIDGFAILGPDAASAVPALGDILTGTNKLAATLAGQSLGRIGVPALPVLLAGLTNRHFRVGTDAALAIVVLGTNARPAIPILVRDLSHPNHFYRERAADALGRLCMDPDVVVPAFVRLLHDDSKAARYFAMSGLGNFQDQARSAAPAMIALLTDADEDVREAATNALRKIAPGALTNSSIIERLGSYNLRGGQRHVVAN